MSIPPYLLILCTCQFRAYIMYVYVSIPCPTIPCTCTCQFRALLFRAVSNSGPSCMFWSFFVSLLPPKNLGEVWGSYIMQLVIPCRTCENRTVIRLCKCVVVLLMFCTMYTAVPPFVEYRFEKKYTHSTGNHRALLVQVRDLHNLSIDVTHYRA